MILQEYNICFTTIEKSADGLVPRLPSSKTTGVLPEVLPCIIHQYSYLSCEYWKFMNQNEIFGFPILHLHLHPQ